MTNKMLYGNKGAAYSAARHVRIQYNGSLASIKVQKICGGKYKLYWYLKPDANHHDSMHWTNQMQEELG